MHDIVELIKWSVGAREKGNKAFEEGEYLDAYMDYVHVSVAYQRQLCDRGVQAAGSLEEVQEIRADGKPEEVKDALEAPLISAWLNKAQAALKCDRWHDAIKAMDKMLHGAGN